MATTFRIVAIAQIYNELRKGNLERFADHVMPLFDEVVVYDDASIDGSYAYIKTKTPHVIRGVKNSFVNEMFIKQRLLAEALKFKPDFIMYIDADEILSANAAVQLQLACQYMADHQVDGLSFHKLNLWRSSSWRRTDNAYDDGWFTQLWRVTPGIGYHKLASGLHLPPYPSTLEKIEKSDLIEVIHYGFASDYSIIEKYLTYRKFGQTGWARDRLIDESTLTTTQIPAETFPPALRQLDQPPVARSPQDWYEKISQAELAILRPAVSIVALIYKSTKWLKFSYEHIVRYANLNNVEIVFIANDAAEHVKEYLKNNYIPHHVFENTPADREEWYINNVYRAWNYGAKVAKGEYVLFVNSDMSFTPDWVEKLLQRIDGHNCVASRLVESGKMPSGLHGISKNFGRTIDDYDHAAFLRYAAATEVDELREGGLYMPLLIKREDFLAVGGYPEGNVVPGSDAFHPVIAKQGEPMNSGDVVLMDKLQQRGIIHQTDFNTISYHFQEGEMDDAADPMNQVRPVRVVIVNDWLQGRMGERTMWNVLTDQLPSTVGLDKTVVGDRPGFEQRIAQYIQKKLRTPVVVQNATFINLIDRHLPTVVLLQDDLRRMGRQSKQQETNLRQATVRVTNSLLTAQSYPEYNFEIIPLGVDDQLFAPSDRSEARKEFGLPADKTIGIFVGDLSPVKGWAEVQELIKKRTDLHWIVVSKSDDKYAAPNVSMFNRVDQTTLSKLYSAANVFVLGSPVETQCLAALEAGFCGLPVVMHETGIFWSWTAKQRAKVGWFGQDLGEGLDQMLSHGAQLSPRTFLMEMKLRSSDMVERWQQLLVKLITQFDQQIIQRSSTPVHRRVWLDLRRSALTTKDQLVRAGKATARTILPKSLADSVYNRIYERRSRGR